MRARPQSSWNPEPLIAHVNMYFREIYTKRRWIGSMGHTHKWQFDEVQLVKLFEQQGFHPVARRSFHNSRIPDIATLERSDFLIVEGVKLGEGRS